MDWRTFVVTIVSAIIASSAFWAFLQSRFEKKDNHKDLLLGLGHDRIIFLCKHYIEKGYISADEYENLYEYLFKPYENSGGNGTAARLMKEVQKIPIRDE